MPCFDVTLNLPGFTITKTSGFNPIIHYLSCHHEPQCPHWGTCDLRKKGKLHRHVWHESVGLRRAFGFRNFENYRRRVRALCA